MVAHTIDGFCLRQCCGDGIGVRRGVDRCDLATNNPKPNQELLESTVESLCLKLDNVLVAQRLVVIETHHEELGSVQRSPHSDAPLP
jgi:hypothetical protein